MKTYQILNFFGGKTMSSFDRLEKKIDKLEHTIERKKEKIVDLKHLFKEHKINEKKFCSKKKHLHEKIRNLDAEIRILKGGLVRKKHELGDSAE